MRFVPVLFSLLVLAVAVEAQRNPSALDAKRTKSASFERSSDPSMNGRSTAVERERSHEEDFRSYQGPDAPLKILHKPRAKYPRGGVSCVQGSVLLKVRFLADETIGDIAVVRGLPHGLDQEAIEAARLIKFVPKIVNGVYVSSTWVVEYSFSIY